MSRRTQVGAAPSDGNKQSTPAPLHALEGHTHMSPRDAASRVGVPTPASARPRRRSARYAFVAATAALVVSAPITADASRGIVSAGAAGLARPNGQPAMTAAEAVRWGAFGSTPTGYAALPWMSLAQQRAGMPTSFGAMAAPAPAGGGGIPAPVRAAYVQAESSLASSQPGCRLPWWLLAGVGYVESGHAAGGNVDAAGRTVGAIYGPVLNGTTPGTAVVLDSDRGTIDGDTTYDRAVGPMQFLPSTWRSFGTDANGDGQADPHNVADAALSAGVYLCSGGGDLQDPAAMRTAILRYNPSQEYVVNVLAVGQAYRDGRTPPAPWRPPRDQGVNPATPLVTAAPGAALPPTIVAGPPVTKPAPVAPAPRRDVSARSAQVPTPPRKVTPTVPEAASDAPSSSTPTHRPSTKPTPTKSPTKPTASPTTPTPPSTTPSRSPSLPYCDDPTTSPSPTTSTSPTATTKPTPTTSPSPTPSPNHTFGPDGTQTPIPTPTCVLRTPAEEAGSPTATPTSTASAGTPATLPPAQTSTVPVPAATTGPSAGGR